MSEELEIDPELYTHTLASIILKNTHVALEALDRGIKAWREQHLEGGERNLADMLVEQSSVERFKVPTLVKACNYALKRKEDKLFGKRAYHKGFITKTQLDEALAFQKQLYKALGEIKRLETVLVDDGFLAPDQAREVWDDYKEYRQKKAERGQVPPPSTALRAARAVGIPVDVPPPFSLPPDAAAEPATAGAGQEPEGGVVERSSEHLTRPEDDRIDKEARPAVRATGRTVASAAEADKKPAATAEAGASDAGDAKPATATAGVQEGQFAGSVIDAEDLEREAAAVRAAATEAASSAGDDLAAEESAAELSDLVSDQATAGAAAVEEANDKGGSGGAELDVDPAAMLREGMENVPAPQRDVVAIAALAESRRLTESRGDEYHTGDTSELELDAAIDEMDLSEELKSAEDTQSLEGKDPKADSSESKSE